MLNRRQCVCGALALSLLERPAGAQMREAVPVSPARGPLLGQARFTFFGFGVYDATLWAQRPAQPEQAHRMPAVLELRYLRRFSGQAIAERSLAEMQAAAAVPQATAQRWLAQMQALFPDVQDGDRLTGEHLPGQAALFWFNQAPLGRIDDAAFAAAFFGIWLAPTTSAPALRAALLGLPT